MSDLLAWHDELSALAPEQQQETSVEIRLSKPQMAVYEADSRFRVLVAGRRFGKTFLAPPELLRMAWGPDKEAWYVAPTYRQAKAVAWRPIKRMLAPYIVGKPNETDLSIELACGGWIALRGAENYDSLRGGGLDGLVYDEFAFGPLEAWTEVLRPMLADRQGRALFIGTPDSFNHLYDFYSGAMSGEFGPDWRAWQFTTLQGGNVSPEEIEAARKDLDERVFRQEFEASFENLCSGLCYWAFSRLENVMPVRFDPSRPLIWTLDFNIDPMCSALCQIVGDRLHVLEEIVLPNSNTPEVCRVFGERMEKYQRIAQEGVYGHVPIPVHVYGDPAGNQRSHSGPDRSDWRIVKDWFAENSASLPMSFMVPSSHPRVKFRVNSVNAMLQSASGLRRLFIDPSCKELIADLEQVAWKTDAHGNATGEVDKSNPRRSHTVDALGYVVAAEFGLKTYGGPRSGVIV